MSIVGPRHGGKTVLMHRLAMKIDEEGGQFAGSMLWNLKEHRFTSDGAFLNEFRNRLVEPLEALRQALSKTCRQTIGRRLRLFRRCSSGCTTPESAS